MRASVNFLNPSEAAQRLGVSPKALRLYEDRGLLRPTRTASGWRAYGPDDLARAADIVALRSLGLSLAQIEKALDGVAVGLDATLAQHEARLGSEFDRLRLKIEKVRDMRRALASGTVPAVRDLVSLTPMSAGPITAFDLGWPWGGERFEVRDVRALNYIVGPLGSGKTRLAKMLAEHLPNTVFLGMERVDERAEAEEALNADTGLRERVEATLAWLSEDGASLSDALIVLAVELERDLSRSLVIDMIEHGLDEPTQHAVRAHLRKRGSASPPLFMLTRSSAILDPSAATPCEAVIFCPANHSPPFSIRMEPGARGYDALTSCLGSPEVRARTEGMIAVIPQRVEA